MVPLRGSPLFRGSEKNRRRLVDFRLTYCNSVLDYRQARTTKGVGFKGWKMEKARKPKALLDAEKKIVEIEKQLAEKTKDSDRWYKSYVEEKAVTDGLHEVLDDLGIRGYRDENKYNRLPMSVRLFSWAMSLAAKKE